MGVSGQLQAPAVFPLEKTRYLLIRRLGLDVLVKRISFVATGIFFTAVIDGNAAVSYVATNKETSVSVRQ
jgi:hypothetical protein